MESNTDRFTFFDVRKGRWVSTDPETDKRIEEICRRSTVAALMVASPLGVKAAIEKELKTS